MAFIPGPLKVTLPVVGAVIADSAETSSSIEAFDRVEFAHDRLRSARTQGAVDPQIVTLIGGLQAQIMFGEITDYARPLTPNTYPTDWVSIKKLLFIQRAVITCGTTPASLTTLVDPQTLAAAAEADLKIIQEFRSRLAIASDPNLSYEDLVLLQSDDPSTYLTGGHSLGSVSFQIPPSGTSASIDLVGSDSFLVEYKVIPGGFIGSTFESGYQLTFQSFEIQSAY